MERIFNHPQQTQYTKVGGRPEYKTGPLLEKQLPFGEKKERRKKPQWLWVIYSTWEGSQQLPSIEGFALWENPPYSLSSIYASEMGFGGRDSF